MTTRKTRGGARLKNLPRARQDEIMDYAVTHTNVETANWLPSGKITVGITAGASCPNNLIEDTIRRLFELRGISVQELLAN